ncbi:response regulator [Enterobacter cloacae]|nr:response regulator [Enterobacter cloacae]UYT39643.1 response regulator [Enterobacter cloacae]
MNILIIEDNHLKLQSIKETITEELSERSITPSISIASDLAQAKRYICTTLYDLVIFDMFLPENSSSTNERDCSSELIQEFSISKNYQTEAIALRLC